MQVPSGRATRFGYICGTAGKLMGMKVESTRTTAEPVLPDCAVIRPRASTMSLRHFSRTRKEAPLRRGNADLSHAGMIVIGASGS